MQPKVPQDLRQALNPPSLYSKPVAIGISKTAFFSCEASLLEASSGKMSKTIPAKHLAYPRQYSFFLLFTLEEMSHKHPLPLQTETSNNPPAKKHSPWAQNGVPTL